MREAKTVIATMTTDNLEGIYEFMLDAEVVDGPPELREIVSELWPELLHKPPRSEMH